MLAQGRRLKRQFVRECRELERHARNIKFAKLTVNYRPDGASIAQVGVIHRLFYGQNRRNRQTRLLEEADRLVITRG